MKYRYTRWHRASSSQESAFFGFFLLLIGVILVLNGLLGSAIPIARTIFAFFLLYVGFRIIFGTWLSAFWSHHTYGTSQDNRVESYYIRKEQAYIRITNEKIYGLSNPKFAFVTRTGNATIDLASLDLQTLIQIKSPVEIYSKTRAGQTTFIIPANIPIEIHAETSWGETYLPNGTHKSGGTIVHRSHQNESPLIIIYTEVRMGEVRFVTDKE